MKLYVGNLPYQLSDTELNELFAPYGTVMSAKVVMDRYTERSRGFGFVEMSSRPEGHKAMESLNGKPFQDRSLVVNEARQEKKRSSGRRW